jgi:hypothetical protein
VDVLVLKKEARDGKEGGWRFLGERVPSLHGVRVSRDQGVELVKQRE